MELNRSQADAPIRASAMGARCVMRVVNHSELGAVLVYEPEVRDGPRALVFENDTYFLRVLTYPAEWRRLAEVELMKLMDSAEV